MESFTGTESAAVSQGDRSTKEFRNAGEFLGNLGFRDDAVSLEHVQDLVHFLMYHVKICRSDHISAGMGQVFVVSSGKRAVKMDPQGFPTPAAFVLVGRIAVIRTSCPLDA